VTQQISQSALTPSSSGWGFCRCQEKPKDFSQDFFGRKVWNLLDKLSRSSYFVAAAAAAAA
jgi:hypothetical protein